MKAFVIAIVRTKANTDIIQRLACPYFQRSGKSLFSLARGWRVLSPQ